MGPDGQRQRIALALLFAPPPLVPLEASRATSRRYRRGSGVVQCEQDVCHEVINVLDAD